MFPGTRAINSNVKVTRLQRADAKCNVTNRLTTFLFSCTCEKRCQYFISHHGLRSFCFIYQSLDKTDKKINARTNDYYKYTTLDVLWLPIQNIYALIFIKERQLTNFSNSSDDSSWTCSLKSSKNFSTHLSTSFSLQKQTTTTRKKSHKDIINYSKRIKVK